MIVDTSAIVAISRGEHDVERVLDRLRSARHSSMSAESFVELSIVLRDEASIDEVADALTGLGVAVVPIDVAQSRAAAAAYRRYGRGSGHPARLNFGDCFTYALASTTGEDVLFVGEDFTHLFVGEDFTHTDLPAAAGRQ